MRNDFPTAKYFRELRFDGLYVASLAAYAEKHAELWPRKAETACACANLRDNQMRTGGELADEMSRVRSRFSAGALGKTSSAT